MILNYDDFYNCFRAALGTDRKEDYDAYVWVNNVPNFWQLNFHITEDDMLTGFGNIWDVAHCNTRDIRKHMGLTQAAFAEKFCIPLRTVQNWENQRRKVPQYIVLLLADAAGMLQVKRV